MSRPPWEQVGQDDGTTCVDGVCQVPEVPDDARGERR